MLRRDAHTCGSHLLPLDPSPRHDIEADSLRTARTQTVCCVSTGLRFGAVSHCKGCAKWAVVIVAKFWRSDGFKGLIEGNGKGCVVKCAEQVSQ